MPIVDKEGVTESHGILGDLDADGDIDGADYNIFIAAFGKCDGQEGYNADCNFDTDGCITFVDYQIWYEHYMNQ